MSNNQEVQEPLITEWEMIPHPSFNQDTPQMNQPTGLEMIAHPTANQKHPKPTVSPQPSCTQVNSSSKKRKRGTAYERQEILEKDFTLDELFKSNNIKELNQGRERTLDPQELLTNLKGWKIEKRRRLENDGNGRVDNQEMESLRSSQGSNSNPMIDVQTVEQVLGSSHGYNHGTGRRLAGMASSSSANLQPQPQEPLYTQRQVNDMLEARNRVMAEKVRALEEQNRATQAQVDSILTLLRSSGASIPPTLGSGNANEEQRL